MLTVLIVILLLLFLGGGGYGYRAGWYGPSPAPPFIGLFGLVIFVLVVVLLVQLLHPMLFYR